MNELNRFVFYGEWLDNIKDLPPEVQDKIIAEIVRYGVGLDLEYKDDTLVQTVVNFTKGAIDESKKKYQEKINYGEKHGMKKKVDDMKIYELAREGYRAEEIAKKLVISKSSVDKSIGWKMRKSEDFQF